MGLFDRLFTKSHSYTLGNLEASPQWYTFNLFSSLRGKRTLGNLIKNGYGKNPHVYSIVKRISEIVSRLDYQALKESGELSTDQEILDMLSKPNQNQYWNEFIEEIVAYIETTGNCFIYGEAAPGMGSRYKSMRILPTQDIEIVTNRAGEIIEYRQKMDDRQALKITDLENVLHLRLPNIVHTRDEQKYFGFAPLETGVMIYTASNNIFEAEAAIFKNRGVIGVLSNDSNVPLLPPERERIQQEWQSDTAGADKFGKVALTNTKVKYIPMGMSPTDLQLIESSITKLRILCNIFGLDSSLFNDPANKTFNNRSEAQRAAYHDVYLPLAEMLILKNLNKWWLQDNFKTTDSIQVDRDKIDALREVNKTLSDKIIQEINTGIVSREEAREILGYED